MSESQTTSSLPSRRARTALHGHTVWVRRPLGVRLRALLSGRPVSARILVEVTPAGVLVDGRHVAYASIADVAAKHLRPLWRRGFTVRIRQLTGVPLKILSLYISRKK